MIKNQRIETISYKDLATLKAARCAEDKDIDYMEQLPDLDGYR